MNNKLKRRKFLNAAGKGLAALFVLKIIPYKTFFLKKAWAKELRVEIHPQAVKRNRKGLSR